MLQNATNWEWARNKEIRQAVTNRQTVQRNKPGSQTYCNGDIFPVESLAFIYVGMKRLWIGVQIEKYYLSFVTILMSKISSHFVHTWVSLDFLWQLISFFKFIIKIWTMVFLRNSRKLFESSRLLSTFPLAIKPVFETWRQCPVVCIPLRPPWWAPSCMVLQSFKFLLSLRTTLTNFKKKINSAVN